MKWKDFLYFSKNDKLAILLLSVLICLCGIFVIYTSNFSQLDSLHIDETEKLVKDFVRFQEDMTDIQPVLDTDQQVGDDGLMNTANKKSKQQVKKTKLVEGQTIDINRASKDIFTRLPGIGEKFAERIVTYRELLGGFVKLDQLIEVKGISMNKFSSILPYIVLNKPHRRMNINTVSYEQLCLHPYLDEVKAEHILQIRKQQKILSIDDLSNTDEFTSRDLERLEPYLSFD